MKRILSILAISILTGTAVLYSAVPSVFAARRPNATDWYIENFKTDITLNQDGNLDIQEDILADCGNCSGKHGIFRIVPDRIQTENGSSYVTPISLESITDETGQPYTYSTTKDNDTITWKIGDPDITVTGEHHYIIHYTAEHAVRDQTDTDELYWNLVGGYWELGIDSVQATIHVPDNLSKNQISQYFYAGPQGQKGDFDTWATSTWNDDHTLVIQSKQPLPPKHDITASLSFPKGLVTSYKPGVGDYAAQIAQYIALVIPLIVLIVCFLYWQRHGKDPRINKTIIPEYEAPDKLSPLMMRLTQKYGALDKQGIAAGIIDFAVNNILTIKEISPKVMLISAQYSLIKRPQSEWKKQLSSSEQAFLDALFESGDEVSLSSLKTTFYKRVPTIQKTAEAELKSLGYIDKGTSAGGVMLTLGIFLGVVGYFTWSHGTYVISAAFWACAIIVAGFSFLMKRYTVKGAETIWKIKGFKLFMDTAEKYRQQWNEKQNFFEQMLPYAIAFDITKKWISKMKEIGAVPSDGYMPAWYLGTHPFTSFDDLTSNISAISSAISSNVGTSSGSSGGGFSGGGGGGGGGGGW